MSDSKQLQKAPIFEIIDGEISVINENLQAFLSPEESVKVLTDKYGSLKAGGVEDVEQYEKVKEAHILIKKISADVEKKRKEIKGPFTKIGKEIDEYAKNELLQPLNNLKSHLEAERKSVEDEIERLQREEIRKEEERIKGRKKELLSAGATYDGESYTMDDVIVHDIDVPNFTDEEWTEIVSEVSKIAEQRAEEKRKQEEELEKLKQQQEAIRKKEEELKKKEEELERIEAEAKKREEEELKKKQEEIDREEAEEEATNDPSDEFLADTEASTPTEDAPEDGSLLIQIAKTIHETKRVVNQFLKEDIDQPWDNLEIEEQSNVINNVQYLRSKSDATSAELHNSWVSFSSDLGWKYGPEEDPDKKTSPFMVPYSKLPKGAKLKMALSLSIVRSFD